MVCISTYRKLTPLFGESRGILEVHVMGINKRKSHRKGGALELFRISGRCLQPVDDA